MPRYNSNSNTNDTIIRTFFEKFCVEMSRLKLEMAV